MTLKFHNFTCDTCVESILSLCAIFNKLVMPYVWPVGCSLPPAGPVLYLLAKKAEENLKGREGLGSVGHRNHKQLGEKSVYVCESQHT